MAYINSVHLRASFNDRLQALKAEYTARLERRRVFVRTRNELQALSNRDLADLGISRSMIKSIAWEAAYGE